MLRAYFQDTITVFYNTGHDIHGEPSFGAGVEMLAHVVWETRLIKGLGGEQVISSPLMSRATVYVMPEQVITHKDKIQISAVDYVVLHTRKAKDFSENQQEVHLA